jgi:hypothetical protein
MTSPGEANVVPISLTLDGRTGYTIWAAPWVEDGDEWQAFLGAGSQVFLFEDLEDLAGYLASGAENDLSDHPAWTMLQTLPADQLEPEEDYEFDLDEIPDLTEEDLDDEVVSRIGDAVDMVQRIAECCDDGVLLNLLESPAFAAVLDEDPGSAAADGDEDGDGEAGAVDVARAGADGDDGLDGDDPWAEIGAEVRTAWPLLTKRLGGCLRWFAAGERPEPTEAEPAEGGTAVAPAGVRVAADADGQRGGADDEGEDTDGGRDEKAARFWSDLGIAPVLLLTSAGAGFTLLCYLDDEPRFLGSDMTIDVFRSQEGLEAFCRTEEDHDLADLETWPQVVGAEPLVVEPAREDVYDMGAAEAQLHAGPAGADPVVLRRATDFLLDVAEYCELAGVREALADDAPLGRAISAVLRSTTGSIFAAQWNGSDAAARWREVVAEVESCLRWHD